MHLNRDVIARAGFAVAARADARALRIREIGTELSADPTAIYRHYRSRDELVFDLIDRVALAALTRSESLEGSWRDRLAATSRLIVEELERYPAVALAAARDRPTGPHELRLADRVLAAVLESGVPVSRGVRLYSALIAFLVSSAAQFAEERVAATTAKEGRVPHAWVVADPVLPPTDIPTLTEHWPAVAAISSRDAFSAGVDALLDAIEFAAPAEG